MADDPGAPDPLLDPPAWAPSWLPTVDDVRGRRFLRWAVVVVFVAGLGACVSRGADAPDDPRLGEAPTGPADDAGSTGSTDSTSGTGSTGGTAATDGTDGTGERRAGLAGIFGTAMAELVAASGEAFDLCVLLADTPEERSRGLMQVTDLEGHDGMVFANDAPSEHPFYMFRTVLPLTVAWWDDDGSFVSAADMEPCDAPDPADCPLHEPAAPYRLALEVEQGSALAEHLAPGATLRRTGESCTAS